CERVAIVGGCITMSDNPTHSSSGSPSRPGPNLSANAPSAGWISILRASRRRLATPSPAPDSTGTTSPCVCTDEFARGFSGDSMRKGGRSLLLIAGAPAESLDQPFDFHRLILGRDLAVFERVQQARAKARRSIRSLLRRTLGAAARHVKLLAQRGPRCGRGAFHQIVVPAANFAERDDHPGC